MACSVMQPEHVTNADTEGTGGCGSFKSPEIVYGEGALDTLEQVRAGALLLSPTIPWSSSVLSTVWSGYLQRAGMETQIFAEVEPNPSYQVVLRGKAAVPGL